jgi:hypothetical protein
MKLKDVEISKWVLSLNKLTGLKVKDIEINISMRFGTPVIQLEHIVFNDGTKIECAGEHEIAFLYEECPLNNCDSETLEDLYKEINGIVD